MEKSRNIYKEDAEGDIMCVGESLYKDDVIHHAPEFTKVPKMLDSINKLFTPKDEDIWLLSYPKSGTHWVHEIISSLVKNKTESSLSGVVKEHAMLEMCQDLSSIEALPLPRIINTHMRPKYLPLDKLNKSKFICVIRNPKSAAISLYHHAKGAKFQEYNGTFKGYLPLYLQGYYSLYGNWFEYTSELWEALKDKENAHFVYYEELKKNPLKVIKDMGEFLCIERKETEFYQQIVEKTSFSRMSQLEQDKKDQHTESAVFKKGFQMLRKGTIDDWKNHFTVAQNEQFDQIYGENMKDFLDLKEKILFQ